MPDEIAKQLDVIREKTETRKRLTLEEGVFLFRRDVSVHEVGRLADAACRQLHAGRVYYNVNTHLNPTNVCLRKCPICAYSCSDPSDPRATTLAIDEILARALQASRDGCSEIHIVGGIHPDLPASWYIDIVRQIHFAAPKLHIKAWTAAEIAHFARSDNRSIDAVLEELIEAGLGSLPGGGAEIFDPEIRQQICPDKIDAETWLDVHRRAHRLGLRSNATILFGHLESPRHRIDHLLRLRALQDETGGLLCMVPLAFHPANTRFSDLKLADAETMLRMIAATRLVLDNVPHVKAYWVSLGVGVAQTALGYGANDLDGTVRGERIHQEAGADSPDRLTVERLRLLIEETGRAPTLRDTLYRPIEEKSSQ